MFGDPARTGKSVLDDLEGRKPTALLALTLDQAGEDDRRRLEDLLDGPMTPDDAAAIREIMRRSGAEDDVRQMIAERAREAKKALTNTRMAPEVSDALIRLICEVTADD